jgi:hypothetical protein
MSNVNSALSVWQLVIMAVVPLAALCGWIITIFMVAREPRAHAALPASSALPALPALHASSVSSAAEAAGATVGGQGQPAEPPARPLAA